MQCPEIKEPSVVYNKGRWGQISRKSSSDLNEKHPQLRGYLRPLYISWTNFFKESGSPVYLVLVTIKKKNIMEKAVRHILSNQNAGERKEYLYWWKEPNTQNERDFTKITWLALVETLTLFHLIWDAASFVIGDTNLNSTLIFFAGCSSKRGLKSSNHKVAFMAQW